jgi:hypothetical protein
MAGRAEKFQHCGTRSNLSVPSGLPGKDVEQSHVAELVNQPVLALGVTVASELEGMFAEQVEYFSSPQGLADPERIRQMDDRYGVCSLGPALSPA